MTELTHLRALDTMGQILTPEDHAYDEARAVFAAHVDARPALIGRVSGPNDVARLIAHARETGSELLGRRRDLRFAVRRVGVFYTHDAHKHRDRG